MTIFRIKKKQNPYLILDKTCLLDTRLSWRAKGLLSYLLSLPNDWTVRVPELVSRSTDGRDAVYAGLKELREFGYIVYHPVARNENGQLSSARYDIYELPFNENPGVTQENGDASTYTEKPYPAFPDKVKPDVLINNKSNKYINNNTTTDSANDAAAKVVRPLNAAVISSASDWMIGDFLTPEQATQIASVADRFAKKMAIEQEVLKTQIELTVLDATSFTYAGKNFAKKLNTIKKCLAEGKWRFSSTQVVKQQIASFDGLQHQLNNEIGEYLHWQRMIKHAQKALKPLEAKTYVDLLAKSEERIKTLKAALAAAGDSVPADPAYDILRLCA
jgi:hypothetical protein